jgi:hypothetical protein
MASSEAMRVLLRDVRKLFCKAVTIEPRDFSALRWQAGATAQMRNSND